MCPWGAEASETSRVPSNTHARALGHCSEHQAVYAVLPGGDV